MSLDQKRRRGTLLCMLLHSAAVIYEAVECVRPRSLSLSLAASEANYGHQCFVALDLDFSQVSANFTAFAKVCRLLYILYCLLLLLLIALLLMRNSFPSQFSKASRYTASSCTDLAGVRFWIGSKKIWDERSYVVKPWAARFFDHLDFTLLSKKSCTNFELHDFFSFPKKRASQGLTVDHR